MFSKKKVLKDSLQVWKDYVKRSKYTSSLQTKLLDKYLQKWKESTKNNWKLRIRAQSYFLKLEFRYRQAVKELEYFQSFYFRLWRSHILKVKEYKQVYQMFMVRSVWRRLVRVYTESRNIQILKKNSIFKKWYTMYQFQVYYKKMWIVAQEKYRISVFFSKLSKWNRKFHNGKDRNSRIQEGLTIFKAGQLTKLMNEWKIKRILQEYKRNLLELSDWTFAKSTKSTFLRKWRDVFCKREKDMEIIDLVRDFRQRKLKQEFVTELKKKMLTRRYVVLSREMYLKKTWFYQWTKMTRKMVQEREKEECIQGIMHYLKKCLNTHCKIWIKEYGKVRAKRQNEFKAVTLSQISYKRKILRTWKQELRERKIQKRKLLLADRYSRKRVLRSFMGLWDISLQFRQEILQKMKRAELFNEYKLKEMVIRRFRRRILEKVEEYYFTESAVVQYNRFLAKSVLRGLTENAIIRQRNRDIKSKAVNFIIERYLSKWMIKTKKKKKLNTIKSILKLNYDFTQTKIYFTAWKDYVIAKNDFMISIKKFEYQILERQLAGFYLKWVDRAYKQKVERAMLEKALKFSEYILLATRFGKMLAIFRSTKMDRMKSEEKIRSMRLKSDEYLKKKVVNAWTRHHDVRLLKNGKRKDAESFFSKRVSLKTFGIWMGNYRHKRWEKKVYSKADLLINSKCLKNSFAIWFGRKTNWKEVYFYQKVKPKMFYETHLKTKTINAWKEFLLMAHKHKERLINAKNERLKLILSYSLRTWIKCVNFLKISELKRSQYLAKKYANIWKKKVKLRLGIFESHVSNYKVGLCSKNITESKDDKPRIRAAPRMPKFMVETLQKDFISRENVTAMNLSQKESMIDFCIQTDPAEKEEILNRIDSGIDVYPSEHREKIELNDYREDGRRLILEKLVAGLFERPLNEHELLASPVLEKDETQIDPKILYEMEQKLSEFQECKIRHKKNLERLKMAKNDVDSILMDPKCPSFMLLEKIQEIESLGKEITKYKENSEPRKHDLDILSQKLFLMIQKTR